MKKVFVFVLFALALFFLVGCNVSDLAGKIGGNDGDGDGDGGSQGSGAATVSTDHKAEDVEAQIQALIDTNGLFLKYEYHSKDSDGEEETGILAFGADGDIYYLLTDGEECYFDFSDDTKLVSYYKNEEGWSKEETEYNEYVTKEQAEEITKSYSMMVTGFMTMYQAYEGMNAVKTSDTVAGRSCDKYTATVTSIGVAVTYSFSIDKATGACLKWDISGVSTEGSGSISFVCKEFNTNYKITLPTVPEGDED